MLFLFFLMLLTFNDITPNPKNPQGSTDFIHAEAKFFWISSYDGRLFGERGRDLFNGLRVGSVCHNTPFSEIELWLNRLEQLNAVAWYGINDNEYFLITGVFLQSTQSGKIIHLNAKDMRNNESNYLALKTSLAPIIKEPASITDGAYISSYNVYEELSKTKSLFGGISWSSCCNGVGRIDGAEAHLLVGLQNDIGKRYFWNIKTGEVFETSLGTTLASGRKLNEFTQNPKRVIGQPSEVEYFDHEVNIGTNLFKERFNDRLERINQSRAKFYCQQISHDYCSDKLQKLLTGKLAFFGVTTDAPWGQYSEFDIQREVQDPEEDNEEDSEADSIAEEPEADIMREHTDPEEPAPKREAKEQDLDNESAQPKKKDKKTKEIKPNQFKKITSGALIGTVVFGCGTIGYKNRRWLRGKLAKRFKNRPKTISTEPEKTTQKN